MNLAPEKKKYDTCSNMKEYPLELQRFFAPHLREPNMISSDKPNILTAWS